MVEVGIELGPTVVDSVDVNAVPPEQFLSAIVQPTQGNYIRVSVLFHTEQVEEALETLCECVRWFSTHTEEEARRHRDAHPEMLISHLTQRG